MMSNGKRSPILAAKLSNRGIGQFAKFKFPPEPPPKSLDGITMPAVSHPRSIQPIGIQPWQAEFTQERFASRSRLPLKRSQVELPQFASRR
ncbi:MAG TPA: hypothetical protein IGP91_08240 [Thermosynechococcus sp. M46_R2017_013]|nr:hypothetical protein [Thermosynechococcus sp. M46_R2017_013]